MKRPIPRRNVVFGSMAIAAVGAPPLPLIEQHDDDVPTISEVLAAFRSLLPHEKAAALRMLERLSAGSPMHACGISFLLDCGWDRDEAERNILRLPNIARGVA